MRLILLLLILLWPRVALGQALKTLADSLTAGQWAELTTTTGFNLALLADGGSGGILGYADKGVWDPTTRKVVFYGAGAGFTSGSVRGKLIKYDDATNTWTGTTVGTPEGNPTYPSQIGHAYNHLAMDAAKGWMFVRVYGSREMWRYEVRTDTWTRLADATWSNNQCCGGIEWYPEMGALVANPGSQNGFLSGIFQLPWVFSGQTLGNWGTWSEIGGSAARVDTGTYHGIVQYSAQKHVVLFGGGNGGVPHSRNLYKLNADGSKTQIASPPFDVGIFQTVVVPDPVSGDFLVFNAAQEQWTYSVDNDSWTQVSGTPPLFGSPVFNPATFDTVAIPISTYGVVMFLKGDGIGNNQKIWLYKHANQMSFSQRAARPGVFASYGMDSNDSLYYTWDNSTSVCTDAINADPEITNKTRYSYGFERTPPGNATAKIYGPSNNLCNIPKTDTAVKHSGAGSLKFNIPGNTSQGQFGSFSEPFLRDYPTAGKFGHIGQVNDTSRINGSTVFWYQYWQRFDPNYLNTWYLCSGGSCGGWKQVIWYGNPKEGSSSSSLEVTSNNGAQRSLPQMYGQQGSDSYGIQLVRGVIHIPSSCVTRACFNSLYPEPPAIQYQEDEWMEFTGRIEVRGAANAATSRVQLWVNGHLVIDYPFAKINWNTDVNQNTPPGNGLGSFEFTPFHTNKDDTQAHPTGYTWIDDIILSTEPIQMTVGGTAPPPDTTPPSAPTNLTVVAVVANQVDLSWIASTDDVAVSGYQVDRCQGVSCSSFSLIASPPFATFTDTSVGGATTYGYRVRAFDTAPSPNYSEYSNTVSATTPSGAPAPPANLRRVTP